MQVWRGWACSPGVETADKEDPESELPAHVGCLLFVVHGIGQYHRSERGTRHGESVTKFHEDVGRVRDIAVRHLRKRMQEGAAIQGRFEFLPLEWFEPIHVDVGIGRALENVTLPSVPVLRDFANFAIADMMVYQDDAWRERIHLELRRKMDRLFALFRARTPSYSGEVAIVGHSLGSVVMFDLLQKALPGLGRGLLLDEGVAEAPAAPAPASEAEGEPKQEQRAHVAGRADVAAHVKGLTAPEEMFVKGMLEFKDGQKAQAKALEGHTTLVAQLSAQFSELGLLMVLLRLKPLRDQATNVQFSVLGRIRELLEPHIGLERGAPDCRRWPGSQARERVRAAQSPSPIAQRAALARACPAAVHFERERASRSRAGPAASARAAAEAHGRISEAQRAARLEAMRATALAGGAPAYFGTWRSALRNYYAFAGKIFRAGCRRSGAFFDHMELEGDAMLEALQAGARGSARRAGRGRIIDWKAEGAAAIGTTAQSLEVEFAAFRTDMSEESLWTRMVKRRTYTQAQIDFLAVSAAISGSARVYKGVPYIILCDFWNHFCERYCGASVKRVLALPACAGAPAAMPEFGLKLQGECSRDWKPYYLQYNRLKGWIEEMEANNSQEAYTMFFQELETNLKRVDAFYCAQEGIVREAIVEYTKLCGGGEAKASEAEQRRILELSGKLQCFAEMNAEGFRKITKKFDKRVGSSHELPEFKDGLQKRMLKVLGSYHFRDAGQRLATIGEGLRHAADGLDDPESVSELGGRLDFRKMPSELGVPLLPLKQGNEVGEHAKRVHEALSYWWENVGLAPIVFSIVVPCMAQCDVNPKLTSQSYLVIWVTANVLMLLVRQSPPDTVLMSATLLLTISGVLTTKEAWAAFSNSVVLSVAGLGVIASAVGETGIINLVFSALLGRPKSVYVAMLRLMLPAVVLNLGISNTCVMSCLLPVIDSWASETGTVRALPAEKITVVDGVEGRGCAYAHDPQEIRHKPDLTNTSMCRTFAREGRCTDTACRYAHSEVQLRATNGFFKMKMCGFWYNCKNGQNCRFAHSPEELREAQQQPQEALQRRRQPQGAAPGAPPCDQRLGGIVEDQTQALPGAPGAEEEGGCGGPSSSTARPPRRSRTMWSDVQDSSGSADQDGSQASSGSCPRAQSSNAVYHGQDGSDSSQGSVEGGSQEGPRSDHTSNHSGTTLFTGESGMSGAAGESKGSPSGLSNSGDSADVTTGASSREPVIKNRYKKRDADKKHDAEQAGFSLLSDGTSTLHIANVPTYFTQGSLLAMLEELTWPPSSSATPPAHPGPDSSDAGQLRFLPLPLAAGVNEERRPCDDQLHGSDPRPDVPDGVVQQG
ncbi:unnamed protein product, partial [Prorocentrum cordatum]